MKRADELLMFWTIAGRDQARGCRRAMSKDANGNPSPNPDAAFKFLYIWKAYKSVKSYLRQSRLKLPSVSSGKIKILKLTNIQSLLLYGFQERPFVARIQDIDNSSWRLHLLERVFVLTSYLHESLRLDPLDECIWLLPWLRNAICFEIGFVLNLSSRSKGCSTSESLFENNRLNFLRVHRFELLVKFRNVLTERSSSLKFWWTLSVRGDLLTEIILERDSF